MNPSTNGPIAAPDMPEETPAPSLARRVVRGTVASAGANVWAMAISLVSLPILLAKLEPTYFGLWVLVQTFSVFTGWLSMADFGAGASARTLIAARDARSDAEGASRLVSASLWVHAVTGLVGAAALALVGRDVLPSIFDLDAAEAAVFSGALGWFSLQILCDQLTKGATSSLEGFNQVTWSRAIDIARRTLVVGAAVVAALMGGDLESVVLASALASIPATLIAFMILMRQTGGRPGATGSSDLRELLGYGLKVGLLRPIGTVHRLMDRVVVGVVMGPAAVTLVEIATQVQNGAEAVVGASGYAVSPGASWLEAKGDREAQARLLLRGTKYSLLIALPFLIVPAILAEPLLSLWVGADGDAAVGLVPLALAYSAVAAGLQVGSELLVGTGRAASVVRVALGAIVVNLFATISLVPMIGVAGAFVGSLISLPVLVVPLARVVLAATGIGWAEAAEAVLRPAVPPAAALALGAAVGWLLPYGDLPRVVVGGSLAMLCWAAVTWRVAFAPSELRQLALQLK